MTVNMITIVISAHPNGLIGGLEELEIEGQAETI